MAGTHLLDEGTGEYNRHLLSPELHLQKGYRRSQGLLFRKDDSHFANLKSDFENTIQQIIKNTDLRMINRNRGSGTRILLDRLLGDRHPSGFFQEAKSHNSVAAAISQKRADWGIAIRSVAEDLGLCFYPIQDEEYDFILPKNRLERPEISLFLSLLKETEIRNNLEKLGLRTEN